MQGLTGPNDLQGAVAAASNGSIGIIFKHKVYNSQGVYVGMSLSGRPWCSRQPKILAYSLSEYIAAQIEKAISDERKAYLDAIRRKTGPVPPREVSDIVNKRAQERREMRRMAPKPEASIGSDETASPLAVVIDPGERSDAAMIRHVRELTSSSPLSTVELSGENH